MVPSQSALISIKSLPPCEEKESVSFESLMCCRLPHEVEPINTVSINAIIQTILLFMRFVIFRVLLQIYIN